jgi:ABC-type sugar transport system ATPase subunit
MIRLESVSRAWPEFSVRGITLEMARGEYLVIVGPTGAGKTLMLELLLGVYQLDAGGIFIDGRDVTALAPEQRGVGMVYQDYLLFPHLTVEQNLGFGLRYARVPKQEGARRVEEAARLLGITHLLHRYPATLSGGERQRAAIGRALVPEPSILLLDEPFSALDRSTAKRLRDELQALHQARGLTVLHVTHDLAEARQMGGRIALIAEGALTAIGSAEELMRRPPTLFAAKFFGAVNLFEAEAAGPLRSGGNAAWLMVRPDEVVLHPASAPAGLAGEVAGLSDEGNFVALRIRIEGLAEPLVVYTSRQQMSAMQLGLGAALCVDVARAIHTL